MTGLKTVLLAEGNPNDVDLTLEALARHNLANEAVVVEDGAEARDYPYSRGKYQDRSCGNPGLKSSGA